MRPILLGLLFVLGCGGGNDPGPGGPGPGSGGSGVTFRKVCQDMGKAVCDKVAMCAPPGDRECTATFEQFCCAAQSDCDKDSGGTRGQLDDCLAGFDALSCDAALSGDVPAACQ